ncbi:MAG: RagB/SusD family nutrient uptake outer membrane protein [Chlamydiia bacterium]|nr:RagB/SusD family nutrient uptake outer membrane protein [Chlamydiia bacterium]
MKTKYIVILALILSFSSCMDMDIQNLNNPNKEDVMSDPDAVKAVTGGLFKAWFGSVHDYKWGGSPAQAMLYMADNGTCFWANFGAVDLSTEPREAFINTVTYNREGITKFYYRNIMAVLSTATDVLNRLDNGMQIGDDGIDNPMVIAYAKFTQGLSNGYLGLVFDKTFVINTVDDYANMEFVNYIEAVNLGVKQIEEAIDICENNSFILPESWIAGEQYSNIELAQLMHSYLARLLVYSARNKVQNDATDWTKVLYHANKGITEDFAPMGDGILGSWKSYYILKTVGDGWGKIDMRIINMMDPTMPAHFPKSGLISDLPNDGVASSDDARLDSDFAYNSTNSKPERGLWNWSSYRYKRIDDYTKVQGVNERIVAFRKAENDLFIAEALIRANGDIQGAADVINDGSRVLRGELSPVSAIESRVMDAIWYERNIELIATGVGIQFFDMRRFNQLQKGTLLHFPFPAQQLQLLGLPLYTFGGYGGNGGVYGEDRSEGGWELN